MSVDIEADRAELLRIYEQDRQAHLDADVDKLFEHAPDEFITVSYGQVDRSSRTEDIERFRTEFATPSYHEWSDVAPPLISVSGDGSMAWMVVHNRIRRGFTHPSGEHQIMTAIYAGLMVYEKRDGKWIRVANAATFEQ